MSPHKRGPKKKGFENSKMDKTLFTICRQKCGFLNAKFLKKFPCWHCFYTHSPGIDFINRFAPNTNLYTTFTPQKSLPKVGRTAQKISVGHRTVFEIEPNQNHTMSISRQTEVIIDVELL